MKKFRRMMALLLAMTMVLSMGITAFAAPASKPADLTGHTYKAYQIFKGTQAADDTTGKLANVDWGTGVNGTALLAALKADTTLGETFKDCTTAEEVADAMKGWSDNSAEAKAFAKLADANKAGDGIAVVDGATTLDAGYYIVVDTTATDGKEDAVKNLSLLQMTKKGTFQINNKTDIPEVEKKVYDANDTEDEEVVTDPAEVADADWKDSADHDKDDKIPYQITGTLPTNYADYNSYKYVFTDEMSDGLTYNGDAKVYAVNGSTKTDITNAFTITGSGAGATLVVSINDLKTVEGATIDSNTKIVVQYTCTLNENAVMGVEGNPNTVTLTYSNNPNNGGEGETGNTPIDKVIVFTYKVQADKVNDSRQPLAGAAFTLYKNYKVVPQGKTAVTEIKYNNDKNTYPIATGDNWVEVGTTTAGTATQFSFERIDDGEYLLVEKTTPAGYNAVKPNKFKIEATHTEGQNPELTGLTATDTKGASTDLGEITLETSPTTGLVSTTIINNSGSTLPETGGMGTTLFYIVGAALVIGAGVVLVSRRRMGVN